MEILGLYLDNTDNQAVEAIDAISTIIPMFVCWESVEMNYIEAVFKVRKEDARSLENALAGLV